MTNPTRSEVLTLSAFTTFTRDCYSGAPIDHKDWRAFQAGFEAGSDHERKYQQDFETDLVVAKAQTKLPERRPYDTGYRVDNEFARGWNSCLTAVEALNTAAEAASSESKEK